MDTKMMKINEILNIISPIRQKGIPFYSNYYNQCKDIADDFLVFTTEHALVFLWDDMGVKRIYFFASVLEELKYILSHLDKESVIDFITKDKEALSKVFEAAGYSRYAEYGRFHIKLDNKEAEKLRDDLNDKDLMNVLIKSSCGEMALESDAEEIDGCLRRVFDSYESHFYSIEKLREHIRKGWVWIVRDKGKIIAGNLFQIQGKKFYGAQLWNDGNIDVLVSLNYKVGQYVKDLDIKYYYCWMRLNNKRIVRYNMKFYGYVPDGLYDMIYVKK